MLLCSRACAIDKRNDAHTSDDAASREMSAQMFSRFDDGSVYAVARLVGDSTLH